MNWYVFGTFWYVLKTFLTHGFGASTGGIGMYQVCICPYFEMYSPVFVYYFYVWHVFVSIEGICTVKPNKYQNVYWYVLVCIFKYLQV
jgi:hypothetical protein